MIPKDSSCKNTLPPHLVPSCITKPHPDGDPTSTCDEKFKPGAACRFPLEDPDISLRYRVTRFLAALLRNLVPYPYLMAIIYSCISIYSNRQASPCK